MEGIVQKVFCSIKDKFVVAGIIVLLYFSPLLLVGQNMVPPVRNYRLWEYNGASKNWDVSISTTGEVFVANHLGLLHFDGERWTLNQLPNKTIVRSVLVLNDKIFTGSYEAFGYWQENSLGALEYKSLAQLIPREGLKSEEFWQIEPYKDGVVFRSFSTLYIYKNNSIASYDNGTLISQMEVIGDKILFSTRSNGFFWFDEGSFESHKENDLLAGISTINFDSFGDKILLGTSLDGCYVLEDGELTPFWGKLNEELKTSQLNKLKVLDNGEIVFGTIKNGLFIFKPKENTFSRLNRAGGLQNNTVLAIAEFKNQLWLGLDNGLDRVQLNAPISYYTDFSGKLGNTYDILKVDNGVLLGSNTGVYHLDDEELNFLEGSQGHVWDLATVSGNIIGGHNKGTFLVEDTKFDMISTTTGGYDLIASPKENIYIQGNYNGIGSLVKEGPNWSYNRIPGFTLAVKYLCFENENTLWVAHPYRGFYRLVLNSDYSEVIEIRDYDDFVKSNYNVKVYRIQNQIIIHAGGLWYRYNEILDQVEVMPEFEKYTDMELLDYSGDNTFWWIDSGNKDSKTISYTDLKKMEYSFNEKELTDRLVPEAQKVVRINDSIYGFTLTDGFAWVNTNKISNYNQSGVQRPTLQSFSDADRYYDLSDSKRIPYRFSSSLTFQVSTPEMVEPNYGYRLNGREGFLDSSEDGTLQFQNLNYGYYDLEIWTIGSHNDISEPLVIAFSIKPPWYLSIISLILYGLTIVGIVFWIRNSSQKKFRRKQVQLKKKLHREQQELLLEKEKESMAKEIRDKQKKLTKTTLNIAKKNEMILELKRLLLLNKESFKNPQRYKTIMSKLNKTVDSKEEWKNFEVNFTELHEDFFEKLLTDFPELTPKDLKLSAYLKMNLSSKEIAPLMGISTRGVEIHRYRLRKKLQIDSSKNLSNFLIRFK